MTKTERESIKDRIHTAGDVIMIALDAMKSEQGRKEFVESWDIEPEQAIRNAAAKLQKFSI